MQDAKKTNWWTRPCGGFDVLRVALPLIISTGSISLMTFTDRMFLLWHSHHAMSAAFQGGLCFWAMIALPHSIAAYVNTFVSQYNGSQQYRRIGPAVWQGIFFGFALQPLYWFAAPLASCLFAMFDHSPEQIELASRYLAILCYSAGISIACESVASFFTGRQETAVVMNVNIGCVVFNIVLDWCLIFGACGFPAWGLEGAAWATVVSQFLRFAIFLAIALWEDYVPSKQNSALPREQRDVFGLIAGMRIDWPLGKRMLWFGGASGFHVFIDAAGFTAFIMLIGGLGPREEAATVIAFTMNMLSFLPLVGTGIGVMTLVGNQIGAGRPDLAQRATMTALAIAACYCGVFAFLYAITPHVLLSGYAMFADTTAFAEIQDLTVVLLRFIAMYLFVDAIGIVFASALKGAGDTMFVMWLSAVTMPILPIASAIGIHFAGLGLMWCWIVLTVWVWVICIFYVARFFGGKWKKMRVIESTNEA
ncbi:MAG: MATE family efflux transporter [Thermoguttaceae bacterium]